MSTRHRCFIVADLDAANPNVLVTDRSPAIVRIDGAGTLLRLLAGPFRTRGEAASALLRIVEAVPEDMPDEALLVYVEDLLRRGDGKALQAKAGPT